MWLSLDFNVGSTMLVAIRLKSSRLFLRNQIISVSRIFWPLF